MGHGTLLSVIVHHILFSELGHEFFASFQQLLHLWHLVCKTLARLLNSWIWKQTKILWNKEEEFCKLSNLLFAAGDAQVERFFPDWSFDKNFWALEHASCMAVSPFLLLHVSVLITLLVSGPVLRPTWTNSHWVIRSRYITTPTTGRG